MKLPARLACAGGSASDPAPRANTQVHSFFMQRQTDAAPYFGWQAGTTDWQFTDSRGAFPENDWSVRQHPATDVIASLNASSVDPSLNATYAVLGLYIPAPAGDHARVTCLIKACDSGAGIVFAFQDLDNFYFLSQARDPDAAGCAGGRMSTWYVALAIHCARHGICPLTAPLGITGRWVSSRMAPSLSMALSMQHNCRWTSGCA